MAVTHIRKLNETKAHWTLGPQHKQKREYTSTYQVVSDSLTESEITILLDPAIPKLGQHFAVGNTSDFVSVVTDASADRTGDNPHHWKVTIQYSILDTSESQPPQNDPANKADPRNWSWEISSSWVRFQKPCYIDINQNPIVNSAGDVFQPPPTVSDDRLQIKCSHFESFMGLTQAMQYKNAVNSDTWWRQAPKTLLMLPITFTKEIIDGLTYYKRTYTIEINPEGWGLRPVDRGLNRIGSLDAGKLEIPPSTSDITKLQRVPICDAFGQRHATPQMLDGHGQLLALGATPVWVAFDKANPPPNGARMADGYEVYNPLPFAALKLPYVDLGAP